MVVRAVRVKKGHTMKTIFVSSTFKDMHFERDAIQEIALPALRAEAMKYGESVSFCIFTEEDNCEKGWNRYGQ